MYEASLNANKVDYLRRRRKNCSVPIVLNWESQRMLMCAVMHVSLGKEASAGSSFLIIADAVLIITARV